MLYIPSAHQSTALLCPFDWMISGAAITRNNVDLFSLINFFFFRYQRQNTFVMCKGRNFIFWMRSEYEKKCFFVQNLTQASMSFVTWIIRFYNDIATATKHMKNKRINLPKYSGVPHKVHVRSFNFLAKPKSVIFKCPSISMRRFSGFKSRYTIDNEWRYSNASTISLA